MLKSLIPGQLLFLYVHILLIISIMTMKIALKENVFYNPDIVCILLRWTSRYNSYHIILWSGGNFIWAVKSPPNIKDSELWSIAPWSPLKLQHFGTMVTCISDTGCPKKNATPIFLYISVRIYATVLCFICMICDMMSSRSFCI